jgi:hypothetical protein
MMLGTVMPTSVDAGLDLGNNGLWQSILPSLCFCNMLYSVVLFFFCFKIKISFLLF